MRPRAAQRSYWGGRSQNGFIFILLAQLLQQILSLNRKPPITIALIAAQVAIFLKDIIPLPVVLTDIIPDRLSGCLNPHAVWHRQQWDRLIWSGLLHADEHHLYYNMASLLWKGAQLEAALGSTGFAALIIELLLVSHGLLVGGCYYLAATFPEYRRLPLDFRAVGFSAVLFGMKVVLNQHTEAWGSILGISMQTKYLCWAELFLASYLNPQASFLGHLAGITAGFIHIKMTQKLLQKLRPWLLNSPSNSHRSRSQHFGGGRLGSSGQRQPVQTTRQSEHQPLSHSERQPQNQYQASTPSDADLRELRLRRFEGSRARS